jgi:hypothetical protein
MASTRTRCIVCGGDRLTPLADLPSVPALCNQLIHDAAAARQIVRARIKLVGCVACGHMFNERFDEALIDYNASYENSLLGSPRYKDYTGALLALPRPEAEPRSRSAAGAASSCICYANTVFPPAWDSIRRDPTSIR